jgi:hypothetical protein
MKLGITGVDSFHGDFHVGSDLVKCSDPRMEFGTIYARVRVKLDAAELREAVTFDLAAPTLGRRGGPPPIIAEVKRRRFGCPGQ